MYIVRSWRDSLSLLAPSNLKLFLLVSLKSTFETYKILFTRFVPIVVMLGMVGVTYLLKIFQSYMQDAIAYGPAAALEKYGRLSLLFFILQFVFLQFFLYVTYAASRPSVGIKNNTYFLDFWGRCILLVVIAFWARMLKGLIIVLCIYRECSPPILFACELISVICWSFFGVWILFFLDSDGWFGALWYSLVRAITMVVYNVPLMGIVIGMIYAVEWYAETLLMQGSYSLGVELLWLRFLHIFILYPLIANIWTNLYIKKTHEQPDLYFDLPE